MRTTLLAALLWGFSATAADWTVESEHSQASFTIVHKMVNRVRGMFGHITGTVHQDEADVTKSTVEITLPAGDIDTRVQERDTHLKSASFFDVKKFPDIRFKSTRIEQVGKNKLRVTGDLSIHGITRPVVLAVELGEKPWKYTFPDPATPLGELHWGVNATTLLNRRDFGMNWDIAPDEQKYVPQGAMVVGNEVAIELNIELVRPAH